MAFIKKYVGRHALVYGGTMSNDLIKGYWAYDLTNPEDEF
jgi:hypothetical protein